MLCSSSQMNKYKIDRVVGDGTYGEVVRAEIGGEEVAIKKMKRKFESWEECMQLREVKALRRLVHGNIVKLREVIRENSELYLVFEYMDCNMYQLMKERTRSFSEKQVKHMMKQVLDALGYMHKHGYFHRDCKPENFLVSSSSGGICSSNASSTFGRNAKNGGIFGIPNGSNDDIMYLIKLGDYGLAREVRSARNMTEYCSTRWYRAPEVLLRSPNYNSPVDLWAVGAIMAELYMLRPLFPGSSESDQLFKICGVLGTPALPQWPDGHRLAAIHGIRFPQCAQVNLGTIVRNAGADGLKLLEAMLAWDPLKRIGAASALCHPYFYDRPSSSLRTGLPQQTAAAAVTTGLSPIPIRDFPSLDTLIDRRVPAGNSGSLGTLLRANSNSNPKPMFDALPKPSEFGRGVISEPTHRVGSGGRKMWETPVTGTALPPAPRPPPKETGAALRSYFSNNARNFFL